VPSSGPPVPALVADVSGGAVVRALVVMCEGRGCPRPSVVGAAVVVRVGQQLLVMVPPGPLMVAVHEPTVLVMV
jgi:hypothetical protein